MTKPRFERLLSPDLTVILDDSSCIVLVTPERRITVGNVEAHKAALDDAKTFQRIYEEESWAGRGFSKPNEESAESKLCSHWDLYEVPKHECPQCNDAVFDNRGRPRRRDGSCWWCKGAGSGCRCYS